MASVPRRLPPTPEERLAVITSRMAGGSNAGSTRWAQPLGASNYRAQVASDPIDVPQSSNVSQIAGHVGTPGTGEPSRYLCGVTLPANTQWLFDATLVLSCNADLDAGAYLLSAQMESDGGNVLANMTATVSQYAQLTQDNSDSNQPGRNVSIFYSDTAGHVVTFSADGTAPSGFGFFTIVRFEGYARNGGSVDDQFRILIGDFGGDANTYDVMGGIVLTELTVDPIVPNPGGGDDGGGGGDIGIS